jgi:hypothetical protein
MPDAQILAMNAVLFVTRPGGTKADTATAAKCSAVVRA